MISNYIKVNNKIKISRVNSEEEWYTSKIQDVGNKSFCIDMPYKKSMPLVLGRGEKVKAQLFSQGERIGFETVVTGKKFENISMFVLALPEEYERVQLRSMVRLPVMMETLYAEPPRNTTTSPQYKKTTALDISGGGIRIIVDKKYPPGTSLLLKFDLPIRNKAHTIEIPGRVIRSFTPEDTRKIHAAMEFIDITRQQQDIIVRFIFEKMSQSRQRNI